ncbi:MAG: MMPL family transporter [Actinomycetota bacterium]
MRRLSRVIVEHRVLVLVVAAVLAVASVVIGGGVAERLSLGGTEDPASESVTVQRALLERFDQSVAPDFVLVITARRGTVDDEPLVAATERLEQQLAREPGVALAQSYWSLDRAPPLKSTDGRQALMFAALGGDRNAQIKTAERLTDDYSGTRGPLRVEVTGLSPVDAQISARAEKDLQRSELLTAPIVFLALIVAFGSLVAALLPMVVGVLAILGTFVVLTILSTQTTVSVFALNLTTALGLGLAIDYSLFIISRYREELSRGVSQLVAVGRTMQTAGRTVAFSAGTVMISLSALVLFPMPYLRSFAFAGVAVVGLAAVVSIVVLPASLAVLGPRVEKGRLLKVRENGGRLWRNQADRVMKHPVPYALAVSIVLLLLAVPFLRVSFGLTDDRVVPVGSIDARAPTDELRENFESRESDALQVFVPTLDTKTDEAAIDAFARRILAVEGVARVDAVTGSYGVIPDDRLAALLPGLAGVEQFDEARYIVPARYLDAGSTTARFSPDDGGVGTWLSVVPGVEPFSADGEQVVHQIRGLPAPFEFGVSGPSAGLVDTKDAVFDRLPWVLGVVALLTFVLLFLMTGSLLVPLKALVMNTLSLTATFGAMVWIFQDGNLSGLLNFEPTGDIDVFIPVLMFCIAFGLSMDYEVFLLSRIKEEYDLDRDNEESVRVGLGKTGRIVTAAAWLLAIVFIGIATSDVALLKLLGVGVTLAVLVDAFLIRATLVPAFMRLAGRLNWWAPAPVRRFHLRWGIWEHEPIAILDRVLDPDA